MSALTEDLLDGPYRARWRLAAGLAFGALAERLRPTIKSGKRPPLPGTSGPLAGGLMKHRQAFFRSGLGPFANSSLEANETVVGSFDAVTASPRAWQNRRQAVAITSGFVFANLVFNTHGSDLGLQVRADLILGVIAFGVTQCWLWVSRSHRLTFVPTTRGLLVFQNGRFNRPKVLRARMPAVVPSLERQRGSYLRVRIGDELVWVRREAEPVLHSMSLRPPGGNHSSFATA